MMRSLVSLSLPLFDFCWPALHCNGPPSPYLAGTVHLYRHIPASVAGPGLKLVGTQEAPQAGAALLALQDGVLAWHMPDGLLHPQLLESHRHLADTPPCSSRSASRTSSSKWQVLLAAAATSRLGRDERLVARCRQALALCHVGRALEAAKQLGDVALLKEVAAAALQFLELPVAVAAYEAAGDEQSLAQLRPLLGEDDGNFLAGQLTALAGGEPRGWRVQTQWVRGGIALLCAIVASNRQLCISSLYCAPLHPARRRRRPRGAAAAGLLAPLGCH